MDKIYTESFFASFNSAVRRMINRTPIVDFGVILNVISDNVVRVGISVAGRENPKIVTCTLVSNVSDSIAVYIKPKKGDKVLVFYPRFFNEKMFDRNQEEVIIDNDADGYSSKGCIAILANMFSERSYSKKITIDDGEIELTNGGAEVTIDKDGNIKIDAKTGKISIKNNLGGSLADYMKHVIKAVKDLVTPMNLIAKGSPVMFNQVGEHLSNMIIDDIKIGELLE